MARSIRLKCRLSPGDCFRDHGEIYVELVGRGSDAYLWAGGNFCFGTTEPADAKRFITKAVAAIYGPGAGITMARKPRQKAMKGN